MNKSDKIYIAGHRGMVGSSILRKLKADGFTNFVLKTSAELNLSNQQDVNDFFAIEKPAYVFLKEEYLLTNTLEYSNEPYAIAKIAGIKLCEAYRNQFNCNFISAMPTNLYGPNDNYDLINSHVLPALIRKFHTAKINGDTTVELWGTGSPMREFLHVDDLAEACIFLMQNYNEEQFVNIGTGTDITIKDLALLIKKIVGFSGELTFDLSKPDGTPKKLLDVTKINQLGWRHKIALEEGIKKVYEEVKQFDFQTSLR